ncbi:hypothetical protein VAB77_004531 [Vibrio vulnificus]|nr:hypothetical protein [Vibrio vulnificus]
MGGAAAGAAIGSAVPVIGTTAGGIIGGLLGAFGGGTAAQKGAKAVLDEFIREDAEEMLDIVNDIFAEMASEYLLNKSEAEEVISQIKNLDMAKKMREMYASGNRKAFARKMLTPMMDTVAESRTKITIPEMEQLMSATKEIVTELAAA